MAWVYVLKTRSDKYYVGSTDNLAARVRHHLSGNTPSTHRLGAIGIVLQQQYATLGEARKIEKKIKGMKRRDYIEKMIKDGYIGLTVD